MEVSEITKILGVKVDNLSRPEILEKINAFLDEEKFHHIATVNPEFVLEAQKNPEFKNILSGSDLNVADGTGIWFAFLRFGRYLKSRLAGADLMMEILKLANDREASVFLACREDGLSSFEEIREAILKIYPDLKIFGDDINIKNKSYKLEDRSYQLLFCNFGAPHQEAFINSQKNDNIRLAMGVGGACDFLVGKIRRAPRFMRILGLEWLWRLFQEPKYRWRRIINATVIFPIRIILNK